jgi:hypothetical protein
MAAGPAGPPVEGACPAGKVAAVGQLKARKQGKALPEQAGSQEKIGKLYRPVHNGNTPRHQHIGRETCIKKPGYRISAAQ